MEESQGFGHDCFVLVVCGLSFCIAAFLPFLCGFIVGLFDRTAAKDADRGVVG